MRRASRWSGRPSRLAEPPILPPAALAEDGRFLRGTLTHALLEHLPALPQGALGGRGRGLRGAAGPRSCRPACARASSRRRWPCCAIRRSRRCSAPTAAPRWRSSPRCRTRRAAGRRCASPARSTAWCGTATTILIVDYKTNRPPPTDRRPGCGGLPPATRRLPAGGRAHLSRHACQGRHSVDRRPANHGDSARRCSTPREQRLWQLEPASLDA